MSSGYLYRFAPLTVHTLRDQNVSNISLCEHGVQWIWNVLGDCVQTPREQASAYLGMLSMAAWLFVVLPQVFKNFRNLDGMAGVSFFLLFQWAGGDVTNLVGAILTHQLQLQIILAGYFVMTDILLLGQYVAYLCVKKRKKRAATKDHETATNPTPRLILCLMGLALISCGQIWSPFSVKKVGNLVEIQHVKSIRHLSRSLLSATQEAEDALIFQSAQVNKFHTGDNIWKSRSEHLLPKEEGEKDKETVFWEKEVNIIGYSIGVLSSVFYLGSRSAQIYKNVRSQSTEGLAFMTFLLAVIGNLSYGAQILVRDLSPEFLLEKTPWLVGSVGVVFLDCTLLCQFHYYSGKHRNKDEMRQSLLNAEITVPINGDDYGAPIGNSEPHSGYIY